MGTKNKVSEGLIMVVCARCVPVMLPRHGACFSGTRRGAVPLWARPLLLVAAPTHPLSCFVPTPRLHTGVPSTGGLVVGVRRGVVPRFSRMPMQPVARQ